MTRLEYIKFFVDGSSASEVVKKKLSYWIVVKYGVKNKSLFSYDEFKELVNYFILNQLQFSVIPITNKSRKVIFN